MSIRTGSIVEKRNERMAEHDLQWRGAGLGDIHCPFPWGSQVGCARASSQISEGVLCPAPTAPNPRAFTGRSKLQWTSTKPHHAAVHKEEISLFLISAGKQAKPCFVVPAMSFLRATLFRAYFVALSPGSSHDFVFFSACYPFCGLFNKFYGLRLYRRWIANMKSIW